MRVSEKVLVNPYVLNRMKNLESYSNTFIIGYNIQSVVLAYIAASTAMNIFQSDKYSFSRTLYCNGNGLILFGLFFCLQKMYVKELKNSLTRLRKEVEKTQYILKKSVMQEIDNASYYGGLFYRRVHVLSPRNKL